MGEGKLCSRVNRCYPSRVKQVHHKGHGRTYVRHSKHREGDKLDKRHRERPWGEESGRGYRRFVTAGCILSILAPGACQACDEPLVSSKEGGRGRPLPGLLAARIARGIVVQVGHRCTAIRWSARSAARTNDLDSLPGTEPANIATTATAPSIVLAQLRVLHQCHTSCGPVATPALHSACQLTTPRCQLTPVDQQV